MIGKIKKLIDIEGWEIIYPKIIGKVQDSLRATIFLVLYGILSRYENFLDRYTMPLQSVSIDLFFLIPLPEKEGRSIKQCI